MKGQQLSSKLSDYDLFAIQPGLRIKGRDQMASVVGLVLTLITFLSLFGLTIYLVAKMMKRGNPNVTVSELSTNVNDGDHVTIAMNDTSFYFGFGLYTEDVVSDPEILDITITGYNYTLPKAQDRIYKNFSMNAVICDWYDNYGQWGSKGFCLDKDLTLLSGMQAPDHAEVQSLNINLSPCSQKTGSPICKDQQKINKIFSESEFRVTYTNPIINHNNHDQPITINYVNYEEYILPGYIKTLYFFITKIKVITDSGWLFESIKEEDAIIVEDQRTIIQPRYDNNSHVFRFVISATDKVIIYDRNYTKIQDVFAEITGLASCILLILAIFARPFFQFKMTEALVNNIYDVMIKEDAHSHVISIIEQSSNNDDHNNDDKKDDGGGGQNLQKSSSLRSYIQKRSKSSKIGIEDPLKKTISTYETQTTVKTEINNSKRQEQPQPDAKDLEMAIREPTQADEPIFKHKENDITKIDIGTGKQKDLENALVAQTLPPLKQPKKVPEKNSESKVKEKEKENEPVEIKITADGHNNLQNGSVSVSAPDWPPSSHEYIRKRRSIYQRQKTEQPQTETRDLEIPKKESTPNNESNVKEKEMIELGTYVQKTRVDSLGSGLACTQPSLKNISKTVSIYQKPRQEHSQTEARDSPESSETEDRPITEEKDNDLIDIDIGENNQENSQVTASVQALSQFEPRYKLDVSFKEWVLSFFRPQLQVKILQEAEELLSRNLDIVTVARNIAEINKLKECLLNDQQRILFDHLPSSFILMDPLTRTKSAVGNSNGRSGPFETSEEEKLKYAYNGLKESQNKSEVDSKILSLYEKKCLNFSVSNKDGV